MCTGGDVKTQGENGCLQTEEGQKPGTASEGRSPADIWVSDSQTCSPQNWDRARFCWLRLSPVVHSEGSPCGWRQQARAREAGPSSQRQQPCNSLPVGRTLPGRRGALNREGSFTRHCGEDLPQHAGVSHRAGDAHGVTF